MRFYHEAFFNGNPEGYVKAGSGNGHLSLLGPLGKTEGGDRLPGVLSDGRRRALEMACLSLWELGGRNLEGGFLYWEP